MIRLILFDLVKECIEIGFHLFCKQQTFAECCQCFRTMGVYSHYSSYLVTFLIDVFSQNRCTRKTRTGYQLIAYLMFLAIYLRILAVQCSSLSVFWEYGMILAVISDISVRIAYNFDLSSVDIIDLDRQQNMLHIILLLNSNQSQFSHYSFPKIFIHGRSSKQHIFSENILFEFVEIG